MARKVTGEIVTKGDMRAQIRTTCENIEKGLAYAGATFDDVVRATTYVTDIQEYYRCSDERFKFFRKNRPASVLIEVSRLGHPEANGRNRSRSDYRAGAAEVGGVGFLTE
jgi:enamine deaminase RidA (YjgF/YER057c/UK114 family)